MSISLQWNNSSIDGNPNAISQRISARIKTVGGPFLTTGFSPANPLATSVNEVSYTPVENKVYEYKIEALCTVGGPTPFGPIEGIAFSCIEPSIEPGNSTANISVDATGTDLTKIRFILFLVDDDSEVASITANRVGDAMTANFSGLTPATAYYLKMELFAILNGVEISMQDISSTNLCGEEGSYPVDTNATPDLRWRPLAQHCEKEGLFTEVKNITGLSSPINTWFDQVTGRMYVADGDDILGNVYWFNPNTAVSFSDMIHSSVVQDQQLYNNFIDGINRKIYFVGANSNGLIVYDIDTNTKTVVGFGTNAAFARTLLTVTDDFIYCNDGNTSIVIIDRVTLTVVGTRLVSGIPTPSHFDDGPFQIIQVNSELWVCSGNNGSIGTIGVYSLDLLTHITEITLTGAATWTGGGGNFWQTMFFDVASGQVYAGDIGSAKRFVIDAATRVVLDIKTAVNLGGKSNAQFSWTVNPVTGDLLALYEGLNSSVDSARIYRVYVEDRATFDYENMYEGQNYSRLSAIIGTDTVVGSNPGAFFWTGPGYATDGNITILGNSTGDQNTGRLITDTLEEYDHNNGDIATGPQKPNTIDDVDYVEPEFPSTCEVVASVDCPADNVSSFAAGTLEYEFAIATAVRNNTDILKIRISAYDTDTDLVDGTPTVVNAPFASNYFAGNFTGLGGTNYIIQIEYLGTADAVLATCLG